MEAATAVCVRLLISAMAKEARQEKFLLPHYQQIKKLKRKRADRAWSAQNMLGIPRRPDREKTFKPGFYHAGALQ